MSYSGKWGESDKELTSNVQEDEASASTTASVQIMLSASAAPLISIARSFEEEQGNQWFPTARPIVPILNYKAYRKPEVVSGYTVQRAPEARVLSAYVDPKALPQMSKIQCIIIKRVAEDYGYLYPYIPPHLEEEIMEKETQWVDEAVRHFLSNTPQDRLSNVITQNFREICFSDEYLGLQPQD